MKIFEFVLSFVSIENQQAFDKIAIIIEIEKMMSFKLFCLSQFCRKSSLVLYVYLLIIRLSLLQELMI